MNYQQDPTTTQPWFPFYPSDFLASAKVRMMTLEERGAYITLLCDQWNDGPMTKESLTARLDVEMDPRGGVTAEELFSGPLGECFTERDGVVFNPRLERERTALKPKKKGGPPQRLVPRITGLADGCFLCDGFEVPAKVDGKRRRLTKNELESILAKDCMATDEAKEALLTWRDYREQAGIKPLTPRGWEILLREAESDPDGLRAKVRHSVSSGYQGLFSPGKAPSAGREPSPNDPRLKPYDPNAPEDPDVVAARERARKERESSPRSCPPLPPQGGQAGESDEGGAPTPGCQPPEARTGAAPDERPKKSLGRLF